jgi:hypothetical protein
MHTAETEDYAGDQPQGPGPDDEQRIKRSPRPRPRRPRVSSVRACYFRWLLDSAAATPRPM